ncbi:LytR/AlgR family response regulator transcription factor [Sporosarcina sp. FSL K6-3457]|uniref:LytR/AlgR family response regulator transcription factor n=1 Tax=Sporosarcina sp. FSL K6-3457 TaxID=2978204 RepID=UPI0030F7F854
MNVVICEDNLEQLSEITKTIHNYALMEDNGIMIGLSTTNPLEVVDYAEKNKVDCYFIDIDLNHEMTGLKLASNIRQSDPICCIIFVTTHSEMSYLTFTYKVAALDFILKDEVDLVEARVLNALKEAHRRYQQIGQDKAVNLVKLKVGSRTRNIEFHDIYFFEASPNPHKLIIHLHNEQIEFSGRLKNYDKLGEHFYRCHKSYIINKQHIQQIDVAERMIIMRNGETCLASSRLLKGLL